MDLYLLVLLSSYEHSERIRIHVIFTDPQDLYRSKPDNIDGTFDELLLGRDRMIDRFHHVQVRVL